MLVDFDKFNRFELPVLTLTNLNRHEIGQLGPCITIQVDLNFNAASELKFEYPKLCENGQLSNLYSALHPRRLIRTENLGYFLITNCEESDDGIKKYLSVTAVSSEIELNYRKLNLFSGTYKFYDPLNFKDTLLGKIFETVPNWHIGYVSPELWNKYRTFDISDVTIYSFLMDEVEKAYECLFNFDTYTRTVNVFSPSDIIRPTDIYVSYNNLIKKLDIKVDAENIYTCMSCYGDKNLSIATVNPLGTACVYNFDYYKNEMTPSLASALNKWEDLLRQNKEVYQSKLLTLKTKNAELIKLQGEKTELQSAYNAKKELQASKIQGGLTNDASYATLVSEMSTLETQINAKESEIENKNAEIEALKEELKAINNLLSFKNRDVFSEDNELELQNYIQETTYQDSSFIQTSEMTLVEIQDMAESLYKQSLSLIQKISKPRYDITVDSVNFLFLPEFAPIVNSINNGGNDGKEKVKQLLGCTFNLEISNDEYIQPVLLSIHLNYSDPTDFSITFANRYRLDDSTWMFDDLYGEAAKANGSMSFDYQALKDWETYKGDLVDFANSSLDLTRNELVNNSKNIEMQFDTTGLIAKKINPDTGDYFNEQAWFTYNTLAFTKDKFATVETALGAVRFPDGSVGYGINGGVLIGKVIFGSQLTIANENNNLIMDSRGFTMTTNNNTGRIILSPSDGIKVQGNNGNGFLDKFYVDNKGNVTMEGLIKAYEGIIGGWNIKEDGLYSPYGDYLKYDGTGKLSLLSWTRNSATFDGVIYADNLNGKIDGDHIKDSAIDSGHIRSSAVTSSKISAGAITASKIAAGSITADKIAAGSITADKIAAGAITIDKIGAIHVLYVDTLDTVGLRADTFMFAGSVGEKRRRVTTTKINGKDVLCLS